MSSQKPDTRTRILRATWKLLEGKDAAAVRMTDIAKRAGISRQALYLHFRTRTELLIATTRYVDEVKEVDKRLAASRGAASGTSRLDNYVEAWGNYIPEIHAIGKALIAVKSTDEAARAAWDDRMQAVRHGCEAAVSALKEDGMLVTDYSAEQATDILWMLLSVENWNQLRHECGWPQEYYIVAMQGMARRMLVQS